MNFYNSLITAGIGQYNSNSSSLVFDSGTRVFSGLRNYFLIMNDSSTSNGWNDGMPNQYPTGWVGGQFPRTAYSGFRVNEPTDNGGLNWEIPDNYKTKYIDSYGQTTQYSLDFPPLNTPDDWDIGKYYKSNFVGSGVGLTYFKTGYYESAVISNFNPPEQSGVAGYVYMDIGDLRSKNWHELCLEDDTLVNGTPFEREYLLVVDEDATNYAGIKGSVAYMESLNGNMAYHANKNMKSISRAYAKIAYTTACSHPTVNGQHNPQDGIEIEMEITIEKTAMFLVNNKIDMQIDPWTFEKRPRKVVDNQQPPTIEPEKVTVSYTFSVADNPALAPFGQKVHFTRSIEMGGVTRWNKEEFVEGIGPQGVKKTEWMKVLNVYPSSIYGKITKVTSKPFFSVT